MTFLRSSEYPPRRHAFDSLSASARRLADRQSETIARQIAIAEIAAPTGAEARRADVVTQWLSAMGLAVRRDAVGNVIASIPGGARADSSASPVVVMAHLDTVFDADVPLAVRHEGPRIVMPGIGDNGRGLAALVLLADVLRADDVGATLTHPIELVATVGEEGVGNLRGARAYFDEIERAGTLRPVAAIALDGPGDSLIVHHGIASRRLHVSFVGAGGHPWADPHAANAIHAAGCAVAAVAQLAKAQPPGVTVSVTRIGGGESLTSVPAGAWFDVDVRALDGAAVGRLHELVRRLSERAAQDTTRQHTGTLLTVTVATLGDRPGGRLDAAHPLVRLAADATRWQQREPRSASASTDANIPLSRGIPAITIGGGGIGGGAHTDHEWYEDVEGARGLLRALGIVATVAQGALVM
ncbi:MAG: M20/M25/M40 family metallo-hydrolase [Gemmatimonadaceae bacterium]|nr:M20/M25/M40 family metallo-hydrolase [Gemmatimonadaceae bacterium]